jgi:tight adherence protein C
MASGRPGQSVSLKSLLPQGVSEEQFYIGIAMLIALVGAWWLVHSFGPRRKTTDRIRAIQNRRQQMHSELLGPKRRRHSPESSVNFMRGVANKLQLVKNLQVGKAETLLIEAGFHSKDALSIMAFFVMALPIVLGVAGLVLMQFVSDPTSKWKFFHYIWPVLGAYMGMKLPWIYVRRCRKKRYLSIQRSLADVLDLMTICAEAGLSLAQMIERVSRELEISYPEMAEELGVTSLEMGFLPERNKALSNLAERCQLPEVRGIMSVLIQTERYGTPIAQALRVLSAEFRQARMLRAEQKAAKLPAIMTIPMIVFILPTLFIIIITPAALKISDTLIK